MLSVSLNKTFPSLLRRYVTNILKPTKGRMEGNVLFNDTLNTFYLRLYGVRHMVKDHSDSERGNLLLPHGLVFRLAARVALYSSYHRQDTTYHDLCFTNRGALAWTRNSSMGPPGKIDPTTHCTMSERSYHGATSRSQQKECVEVYYRRVFRFKGNNWSWISSGWLKYRPRLNIFVSLQWKNACKTESTLLQKKTFGVGSVFQSSNFFRIVSRCHSLV